MKTVSGTVWALLAMLLVAGTVAAADDKDTRVYRWQDESGTHHYGDRVPPEYVDENHSVLNEYGVEVEQVKRRLTPEEQAAEKRRLAKIEQEKRDLEAAALRDKVLLSTYLSVAEIEALRDRRVELLGAQIRITQKYLDNLREKLIKLEREAQRYSPYSANPDARPIDEKLARELSDTLNSILLYEKNLAKSREEQQQVIQKFAADITRFNELQGITKNN